MKCFKLVYSKIVTYANCLFPSRHKLFFSCIILLHLEGGKKSHRIEYSRKIHNLKKKPFWYANRLQVNVRTSLFSAWFNILNLKKRRIIIMFVLFVCISLWKDICKYQQKFWHTHISKCYHYDNTLIGSNTYALYC